mgnify:FL=1
MKSTQKLTVVNRINLHNQLKDDGKTPPYNTGKVVIGKYHERYEPVRMSEEDEFWQGVLINRPSFMRGSEKRFWLVYSLVMCMVAVLIMGATR